MCPKGSKCKNCTYGFGLSSILGLSQIFWNATMDGKVFLESLVTESNFGTDHLRSHVAHAARMQGKWMHIKERLQN